ncbi:MAG: helix-turn-helix domain-containing protein, partial [Verrucomicrobiota bacterium]
MEAFEEQIRIELHQFYGSPQQVAQRLEDAKKYLVENEQELAALQNQVHKAREEMRRMVNLYAEGHLTKQAIGDFCKPAEERLNQMLARLPKLEAEVARLKVKQVSSEEVVHEARTLYEQWPKLDIDRKRSIVETVFERIELKDGETGRPKIAIIYSDLPSSEELCINQQRMGQLLGIAQRTIIAVFDFPSQRFSTRKLIPVNVKTLGDQLHLGRIKANLSQPEVAQRLRVSTRMVRKWEYGQTCPNENHW